MSGAAPRVAAEDATHGEPRSAQAAMDTQCLDGIFGAGGCETAARREQRRDGCAVEADGENKQFAQKVFHRVASSLIMARSTRA